MVFASPPQAHHWEGLNKAYALCTTFLLLKCFVSVMLAGDLEKTDVPEDKCIKIGDPKNHADRPRYKNVASNDLENIPLHLVVFWGAFIMQTASNMQGRGSDETIALGVFMVIYTTMRFFHSICYYTGLQPWRTVFFLVSMCCVIGAGSLLVSAAWNIDTSLYVQATIPTVIPV